MAATGTKRTIWAAVILGILLVGAIGVSAFSFGKYEKVKVTGGVVSIPVSRIANGKAHFYRFDDGRKQINFIIAKAADGSIKSAFDACDTCFHEKKGYEQQGDKLVCQNCNRQFAIRSIGPHAVGGCNPSYLPSQLRGGNVTISAADLRAGARFF